MAQISGWQAIKILKQGEYANIPVVFLSADSREESKKKALQTGAVGYIEKPFNSEHLVQCIDKFAC